MAVEPSVLDHASLALLNALLAVLVLSRAGSSWLARVLGTLFAINVVTPLVSTFSIAGYSFGPATYARILDAQSVASLLALALLPGLVYRETNGRGQRILAAIFWPTAVASAIYLSVRYMLPEVMSARTMVMLSILPWGYVITGGVVALLDLALRTTEVRARQRVQFFLGAFVLATVTTFEYPIEFLEVQASSAATMRALTFIALCALALPLVTFLIQRLRALGGGPRALPLTPVEWVLLVGMPLVALALVAMEVTSLSYGLVRPIVLTSGILLVGIAGDGRSSRALAAAVVVVAAAATSLWVTRVWDAPALAPLVGVGLALLMLWPLAKEALGQPQGAGARTLYEAALAASLESGAPHDARVLKTLRARLNISEKEHGMLEMSLRQRGARELSPETRLFGRYRIQRRLGAGASGATYLAYDEQLGRSVSLKVAQLPADDVAERLMREARILARLRHPNIPRVLDVERVGPDVLLVLEYVEGEPLDQRLARGKLPVAEGLRIAEDVLAALTALHAEGLVHRDVKPSNVILSKEGRAFLIDYGIAADAARTLTMSGGALPAGTVAYMSPEQLASGSVDARSDLFSLGATLYETLTGETYFPVRGRALQEVAVAVAEDRPRIPRELPAPVATWLLRALEKDPKARPASAREMLATLPSVGSGTSA